ncbi:hypothetical protein [Methylobacterium sp. AMS5]|uniref:hypothetical protein n=1 Tax=Methylobacterium sp. AMS5 TaxID=925818 RepID=UPI00074F9359|nr:hypothetical protein [Methylobacterium sp. AMS5]AMB45063.1 hypothetical protein Y590_09152 [Methylobacterium sp. AMS5]
MNPQQSELVRKSIADLKTISLSSSEPHNDRSLSTVMNAAGINHGFVDFAGESATGFSNEGMAIIAALAKTYRPEGDRRSHQVSNETLTKTISASIAQKWRDTDRTNIQQSDIDSLGETIDRWLADLNQTRLHVVPCALPPYVAPSFQIGPVCFHHVSNFPTGQFGIQQSEFWPTATEENPNPKPGGFHFERLLELATERRAPWLAVVEVSGRAIHESITAADVATDIALGALQIAAPGLNIRNISRATARAPVFWRVDPYYRDGQISENNSNLQPALTIHPDLFADVITNKVSSALNVMGKRLSDYLQATSAVPDLDEAWCNAAYWFHEALAETLETVAVVKLETAIEVLFRAENMSGSKSRIIKAFDTIFGLTKDDVFSGSGITVEQFTLAVTTARSRVVHGTWPTIHTDLPGYKKNQPVARGELEMVASSLLIEFAHQVDAYVKAGQTADETDALLDWIKAQRQPSAPTANVSSTGS